MFKTVILSDDLPCKVRGLGLFELDGVGREVPGPYRYSLLLATGQIIEDEYDLRAIEKPPEPPTDLNPEPGSWEWSQLQEYETYLAAVAHESKRTEAYEGYAADVAAYILENCLAPEDRGRVVEPDDWHKIQRAAVVPRMTEEAISQVLADTFQGVILGPGRVAGFGRYLRRNGARVGGPVVGA